LQVDYLSQDDATKKAEAEKRAKEILSADLAAKAQQTDAGPPRAPSEQQALARVFGKAAFTTTRAYPLREVRRRCPVARLRGCTSQALCCAVCNVVFLSRICLDAPRLVSRGRVDALRAG
jgi:hypothetical protein